MKNRLSYNFLIFWDKLHVYTCNEFKYYYYCITINANILNILDKLAFERFNASEYQMLN